MAIKCGVPSAALWWSGEPLAYPPGDGCGGATLLFSESLSTAVAWGIADLMK